MSDLETLTDEERAWLRTSHMAEKALRCINQRDALLKERDAEIARLKEELDQARRELLGWSKDVARLTSQRDAARLDAANVYDRLMTDIDKRRGTYEADVARLTEALAAAERKIASNGNVAELAVGLATERAEAAEQKLAAAEREMRSSHRVCENLLRERDAAEARVRELTGEWADLHVKLTAAESELARRKEKANGK